MARDSRQRGAGKRDSRQAGLAGTGGAAAYVAPSITIYGTPSPIDTARSKVKTLIDALKTTMASGYDPTFSYTYTQHRIANLRLNAVTIEADDADAVPSGSAVSQSLNLWIVTVSIRVHTAYRYGHNDWLKNVRLLTSISNYINEHRNLGDEYRVLSTGAFISRASFDDSATLGGEMRILVQVPVEYTQS
ncbi:MAG: hypothetical protein WC455_12200 [Dehalococcoidia bacterium]|jgi:hypothetical protein